MSNGKHLILDLYECNKECLDDYSYLEKHMKKAVEIAKARIINVIGEKFSPQGVTILALLAESHCSIHTWPEIGYAAVDLYTCGDTTNTHVAAMYLKEKLEAKISEEKEICRSITPSKLGIVNQE